MYPDDIYCGNCGSSLQPTMTAGSVAPASISPAMGAQITCPTCGHLNEPDAIYCEVDGASLKITEPLQPTGALVMPDQAEVALSQSRRTFGRSDFVKYVKQEQLNEVSRAHFTIIQENGAYYLEDGGPDPSNPQSWKTSVNKTFLNGVVLQPGEKHQLKPNDTIDVAGVVRLTFKSR